MFILEPIVIILLLVLGLTITIGFILHNPVVGLVLICFCLPFDALIGEIPIPFYTILGTAVVGGYLIAIASYNEGYQTKNIYISADYIVVLFYVLWIILRNPATSLYYQDPFGRSYSIMFTYIQLGILYYLSSRLFTGNNLSWMGLGLMLGTTFSAIYELLSVGIDKGFLLTYRLIGAQGDPNALAIYALCSLAFLPLVQKLWRNNWQFWLTSFMGVFQIIIVFLTMSKTGFLALGFLILLWVSFYKAKAVRRNLIIVIGFLLVLTFFTSADFWESMYKTITSGVLEKEGTMGDRYLYWQAAFLAFSSAPIWGIGVGQFQWLSMKLSFIEGGANVAHNVYLTILAESGIVGLLLFLGWMTLALHRFWVLSRRGQTENVRIKAFSGLCAFAMVLFMAMTLSIEYYKILWLLAGSSIAIGKKSSDIANEKADYGSISHRYNRLNRRGIK
jgi:O-antigen ligase